MILIPRREDFKVQAKALAREKGIGPAMAHEQLARSYGFKSHNAYLAWIAKHYV